MRFSSRKKLNQKENQNVEAPSLLSLSPESRFSNPLLSQNQASLTEKGLENRQNTELPICRRLPETDMKGLLECPYCKEEGKNAFFSTAPFAFAKGAERARPAEELAGKNDMQRGE